MSPLGEIQGLHTRRSKQQLKLEYRSLQFTDEL